MAPPWRARSKRIDNIAHQQQPARLNLAFNAPAPANAIRFRPKQLYASVARAQANDGHSVDLIHALTLSNKALIEALVDDQPSDFAFTTDVLKFADAKRTAFSGDIGGGITDRYMEALGYVWRDNARNIVPTGKVADFVYDGPPTGQMGVVLAEAKGSITPTVTANLIATTVSAGYTDQVELHIGTAPGGTTILHGYAVGIGSRPGNSVSNMHVVEPAASAGVPPGGPGSPGDGAAPPPSGGGRGGDKDPRGREKPGEGERFGSPNPRVALGNYRAVFALADARTVVDVIDSIRTIGEGLKEKLPPQRFIRLKFGRDSYLIGRDRRGLLWGDFAVHEAVARKFLGQLKLGVTPDNQSFTLPIFPTPSPPGDKDDGEFVELLPDGLAVIARPFGYGPGDEMWWDPNTGQFSG
jgi:hypothetical protein